MRRILQLAANDVRLTVRDRTSFIWMLILPLALMWLFGHFDHSEGAARARLTVVDEDGGWLARAFVDELGNDDQIDVRELAAEEAEAAQGKVRTLYVPSGFTAGILAGRQQTLRLEKEPDTNEEFALAAEVKIIRTAVSTVGRLVEMSEAGNLARLLRDRERAAERFAALGERAPLVRLHSSSAGSGRPVPSGHAQSVPGILTMTVMMMTIIYGAVFLTTEKRTGMLRRMLTLPVGRGQIFAGKLLGRLAIAALQTILLLLVGRFVFGLSYGDSPAGLLLLVTSYCIAAAGLATMLGALLRTPEQAGSIGWMLAMLLAALGGCWWPAEIMPRWMWQAAHALPTAWAMDGFHALISFGHGVTGVLVPSFVLLGFGLVFSTVGARYLRTAGGGA